VAAEAVEALLAEEDNQFIINIFYFQNSF
jgi:hypothetical protein